MSFNLFEEMMRAVRYFGVDEARRLVPLLTETFTKVRDLLQRAQELSQRMESLAGGSVQSETKETAANREKLVAKIREEIERLADMGIEVKSLDGLVDFRALRDGRQVYLCWRFGETTIDHWHELQTGFAGRRPIENSDRFTPSYMS